MPTLFSVIRNIAGRIDLAVVNRCVCVLVSGFLTFLAFPHEKALSYFAWICMVPWLISLHRAGWVERLLYGVVYGGLYILPGHWVTMFTAVSQKDWSQWITVIVVVLFFSCYIFPFAAFSLCRPFIRSTGILSNLRMTAVLTCLFSWTPTYFPVTPAVLIHDQPFFLQLADLAGIHIIIFIVLFVNIVLAEMVIEFRCRKAFVWNTASLLLFLTLTIGYGAFRMEEQRQMESSGEGERIHISAVQTRLTKFDSLTSLVRQNSRQRYSALEWSQHSVDRFPETELILLPELPIDMIYKNRNDTLQKKVSEFAIHNQKAVLFNSMEEVKDASPARYYNVAQLVRADGSACGRYRKKILSPFYEYNPFSGWIDFGNFYMQPGGEIAVLDMGLGRRVVPSICYEIHSAGHLREFIQAGGNVITHLANFQAFGEGPISFIDLAMTKLYAIEYRVPIAKSSNAGYGAFIRANGVPVEGSINPPNFRNALSYSLFIPNRRSTYTVIGDLFLYGLTLTVLVLAAQAIRRRFLNPTV